MSGGESPVSRALVERLAGRTVVVIGDVMLDQFLVGRVHRISPEAPVPVVEFDHDEFRLGGAANVAHNIRALGGRPVLVGLVGTDDAAERLRCELREADIGTEGLVVDPARRTTCKLRIVTDRRQQVARVDYETDREADGDAERALADAIGDAVSGADVIVVSDYLKGVVTRGVMRAARTHAQSRGISVLVDPKIPHLAYYTGVTLVTPNHYEAEVATHQRIRTEDEARSAARALRRQMNCQSVMITRGEHGLWLLEGRAVETPPDAEPAAVSAAARTAPLPPDPDVLHERNLAAVAQEVSDVTGAGDTVIATVAMGLAAGASLTEAAELANYAAGIAVARFGPTAVTHTDLLGALGD